MSNIIALKDRPMCMKTDTAIAESLESIPNFLKVLRFSLKHLALSS